MRRQLSRIIESIANLSGYLAGWLVLLMMILVLFEVFMRYVVHQPPMLADEFAGYMLVAISFIGMAYTWKEKGHVRITIAVSRLPARVSSLLRLITLVLAFVFMLGIIHGSYKHMALSFKVGQSSGTWLHFPLQGPQLTIIGGFSLLALILIVEIVRAIATIRSGKSAEEKVR